MAGTFLWNFIKIQQVVSEMFKENLTHARTDGHMDARRITDHDISSLAYDQWS